MSATITPLDSPARRVIRLIEQIAATPDDGDFGTFTEEGIQEVLTKLRTALPAVQALVLSGTYLSIGTMKVERAVDAMLAAVGDERSNQCADECTYSARCARDAAEFNEQQALYFLGILVGAELAGVAGAAR